MQPIQATRFALPTRLPARYLRTLEHDPGGYDPASPPGGPARGGASDLLLGDLLFHSPATLGPRAREAGISCQSCHPNGAANAGFSLLGVADKPGLVDVSTNYFRKGSDDGLANPLSIPSLRGARFTAPYGHDGRTASLAEFVQSVVTTEFDGRPLEGRELAALVRYVQDLDFLPCSNLDERARVTDRAGPAARRGEALFAKPFAGFDGKSCASCHDPSTFFRDGKVHRLGSVAKASARAIEDGEETPTLLGTSETAPYFHDGRFATIAEVVDWFDASFHLGLSKDERADLTAYTTAVGAVDRGEDDRPLARRLAQTFAYVELAEDEDARVRVAAIEEVWLALASPPSPVARRANELRARVLALRDRLARAPAPREDVRATHDELVRLAADWAGAVTVP